MNELYELYGRLMVEQELLAQKINITKQKINEGLNKPKETNAEPVEAPKEK